MECPRFCVPVWPNLQLFLCSYVLLAESCRMLMGRVSRRVSGMARMPDFILGSAPGIAHCLSRHRFSQLLCRDDELHAAAGSHFQAAQGAKTRSNAERAGGQFWLEITACGTVVLRLIFDSDRQGRKPTGRWHRPIQSLKEVRPFSTKYRMCNASGNPPPELGPIAAHSGL